MAILHSGRGDTMIARLLLTAWLVFLLLAWPAAALEQQPKVYKIGISEWTGYPTSIQGFKIAMAAAGFIEGRNIEYLFGRSGLDPGRQREIAESFKGSFVCFGIVRSGLIRDYQDDPAFLVGAIEHVTRSQGSPRGPEGE